MVGLGNAAKKIQQLSDLAEKLYARVTELREMLEATQEQVDDTHERVTQLERQLDEQRALVDALAEEQGLDPEMLTATAAIEEAESGTEPDRSTGDE